MPLYPEYFHHYDSNWWDILHPVTVFEQVIEV